MASPDIDYSTVLERECIAIASAVSLENLDYKSLLGRINGMLKDVFDESGLMLLIAMPIFVILLPVSLYEVMRDHIKEKSTIRMLERQDILHAEPLRSLPELWRRYGLKVSDFCIQERQLAACLAQ